MPQDRKELFGCFRFEIAANFFKKESRSPRGGPPPPPPPPPPGAPPPPPPPPPPHHPTGARGGGAGGGWRAARGPAAGGAGRQAQVRAKDFFGHDLFLQKVIIPCGFDEGCSDFYPVLERFEPIILLLFNPRHFLVQRLLFG